MSECCSSSLRGFSALELHSGNMTSSISSVASKRSSASSAAYSLDSSTLSKPESLVSDSTSFSSSGIVETRRCSISGLSLTVSSPTRRLRFCFTCKSILLRSSSPSLNLFITSCSLEPTQSRWWLIRLSVKPERCIVDNASPFMLE